MGVVYSDSIEVAILRQAIKMATLISNQEFGAYYEK